MDQVCSGISFASMPTTYITGTTVTAVTYNPTSVTAPTYTRGTTTLTATLFSVLNNSPISTHRGTPAVGSGTTRYTFSGLAGNWINPSAVTSAAAATPSATLVANSPGTLSSATDPILVTVYTYLTSTNIPGTTKLMINPNPAASVTGQVTDAKESVSMDLMYSLKYEFCYWAKAYKVVLGDYITVQNNTSLTTANKTEMSRQIINQLNSINLRLSDLTMIAGYIGTKQSTEISGLNTNVNTYITDITTQTSSLQAQSSMLSSSDVKSKLRSRMLQYSEEKNAYANQLLATYGCANLIALGLLFYIYRS